MTSSLAIGTAYRRFSRLILTLRDAVLVTTQRASANGNGVATYAMRIVGRQKLDVTAGTVFETYYPACFTEGMVAKDRVDIQSNSYFSPGFCVHSQDQVAVNSGNTFAPGVIVSMPDWRNVELPASGFSGNTGLEAALRDASYQLKILRRITDIIRGIEATPFDPDVGIMSATSRYHRGYITDPAPISIEGQGATVLEAAAFKTGRIHVLTCNNDNSHKEIGTGFVMRNMVIVTDCRLQFNSGAIIEDLVIISTNTGDQSFYALSNMVIGKDDDCATGGDVQMVTLGSVDFASSASFFGSQIIAAKDISVTANADGIEGIALVAGGKLDVTSNGAFGFCGGAGMNNNYAAAYFRLAH